MIITLDAETRSLLNDPGFNGSITVFDEDGRQWVTHKSRERPNTDETLTGQKRTLDDPS